MCVCDDLMVDLSYASWISVMFNLCLFFIIKNTVYRTMCVDIIKSVALVCFSVGTIKLAILKA